MMHLLVAVEESGVATQHAEERKRHERHRLLTVLRERLHDGLHCPMHILWQFWNTVCNRLFRLLCRRLSLHVLDIVWTEIQYLFFHLGHKGKPNFSITKGYRN